MTLVVDIILRLLMWGWREARFGEGIACLSYTKVGHVIAAGCSSRGRIYFMSAQTGEKILCPVTVDSGLGGVRWVSFSPMGVMIAAGCANGKIYFIDAQSGEVKRALMGHSEDNTECICEFNGRIKELGKRVKECPVSGHSRAVSCLAFKPDDPNILVSGSWDKTLKIWDLSTGACLSTVRGHSYDNEECKCYPSDWSKPFPRPECPVSGHSEGVSCLAFKPDDFNILVTGSYDTTLKIWDLSASSCLCTVRGHSGRGQDGCICHVDENGDLVGAVNTQCPVNAHSDIVCAVSWSTCGKWLASGGRDNMVYIYDAQTFEVKRALSGHSRPVSCLAFKPGDPNILVTGSWDKTLKIWDLSTAASACLSTVNGHRYALFLFF